CRLTGVAAGTPMITVTAGFTGTTIQNFTMRPPAAAIQGIEALAPTIVQGVTFDDAAGAFGVAAIELGGNDCIVRNNIFDMTNSGVPAVQLTGGMGAQILNNEVRGVVAPAGRPSFFVENNGAGAYNGLTVADNTGDFAGTLIGTGVGDTFSNSVIRDNTFQSLRTDGIDLGNATNVEVLRNTYTYRAGAAGMGLQDTGGSNNVYSWNRITHGGGGANIEHAIQFASTNTWVDGNIIDATDGGCGIDASPAPGASNAIITNNTILGAGINLVAPLVAPDGIRMNHANNSNFTVEGNNISNTAGLGINNAGGGTNHVITNNVLNNIHDIGIASAGNNNISGNMITGTLGAVGGPPLPAHGIQAGVNDTVRGNTIRSVALGHGIDVTAGNALIEQNTIDGVSGTDPVGPPPFVSHGINVGAGNCNIAGNFINNISGGGHGIILGGDNETVSDNTITNIHTGGRGIDVALRVNNRVSSNVVDGVSHSGIRVGGGDNNDIIGNTVRNVARDALDTPGSRFAGIKLEDGPAADPSTNNVVDGNTVENAGSTTYAVGIDVEGANADNNDITGNVVRDFTTVLNAPTSVAIGIRLQQGINCVLNGNNVSNTGHLRIGIDVIAADDVPVRDNIIEGMIEIGLRLRGGTCNNPLEVEANTLLDNVTGISMEAGGAEITNVNKICGGAIALYVGTLANSLGFKVNGNCIGAPILVRNVGLGTLDATGNYWATTPQAGANVFGLVDVSNPLNSCPSTFDCPSQGPQPPTGDLCCTYPQGWNLISMPAVPSNPDAASIFDALPLYEYDACIGTYSTPTDVSSTEGYWLYLTFEQEFCIDGTVPLTDQTIVLPCAGWHLIGTCFDAYWLNTLVTHGAQMRNVADAGNWILLPVFSYDPVMHSYSAVTWLVPCLGYWVYTLVDNVTLTIPFAQPPTPSSVPLSTMELPQGLTPPPPPSLDGFFDQVEDALVFTNAPNPVTDVHTTTFMVKGALSGLVEQIKVQVFDLTGRLIYEDQRTGTELAWHTDSSWGEYLANGVYLYRLSVLIDGQWIVSEVKKLAVMR
ncbi:right-handed parallel beta-helix repeat-containing protein, partial [Candidatus Bipolaricaulota bacterium]|nr:right-handed parallel beta-helix repeat-containing protein [Candidatus Bipolaricaulota bacterium]